MISVGIDVSKGKSTVCIMKPGGEVLVPPFEMVHTVETVLALVNRIKSYGEDARVIVEDTGHYHWPVVTLLAENNVFVCSVNALRMKKYCSQNIRRAKTDRIDSIQIASYGLTYWHELTPTLPADSIYRELRFLSRQYCQSTGFVVKAKVNFSNILDQVMPGLNTVMRDNHGNRKLTDFAKRYWHYEHILEMGERKFISDYCKWAKKQGYRMYERLANVVFAMAQNTLIAYAGIDAPPYQSGTFTGTERHITKLGNAYLRRAGFEAMQCILQQKPVGDSVYEFMMRKHSEGKCGKEAMIAGLNKFLRVYYGRVSEVYQELMRNSYLAV